MWRLLFIGIGAVVLIFVLLSFTNLPSVSQLENPKSELASVVYGATGAEIGRYYIENRVPVGYEELSPHLVNALVATEDERYYAHTGIDFRALGRVAVKTIALQKKGSGGASTITQQLAKLLFTGQKADGWGRVLQKLREWIIAVRLERRYTKEEILAMYLNKFPFINGAYGIKAASEIYFDRPQDSLEIQEAAVLIGMLKNPSLFNPLRRPEQVVQRRNVVFTQMYKNGLLRKDELESLKKLPLGLRFTRQTHIDGIAPYFRMELAKHIKEEILAKEQYYKPDGTPYDIYRDGLRIYTTIDPEMQTIAEDVMARHMAKIQNVFFKTWNKRDPWKYSQGSDTEIPVAVRAQRLKGLVRASDRYQVLRDKYLLDVTEKVRAEMGDDKLLNEDWEIDLVMAEAARPDSLSRLVKAKKLKEETAKRLKSVLRSDHFTKLRTAWTQLQDASDREFNTPVAMRVFAYNDSVPYLVDRDGTVYRLMPDSLFGRHCIGLNYMSIGIENVGDGRKHKLTKAQLEANVLLIRQLFAQYPIEYLIGHHEYLRFKTTDLWKETDPNYFTNKVDPGKKFMRQLRKRLKDLTPMGPPK